MPAQHTAAQGRHLAAWLRAVWPTASGYQSRSDDAVWGTGHLTAPPWRTKGRMDETEYIDDIFADEDESPSALTQWLERLLARYYMWRIKRRFRRYEAR